MKNKYLNYFLKPRAEILFHPESPGIKVRVVRSWIGRLTKPEDFATLTEARQYKK